MPSNTSYKMIRSLTRGIDVLRYLNSRRDVRAIDVARHLKIPRATVYRILETFIEQRLVFHSPSSSTFRLAAGVLSLSDGVVDTGWIKRIGLPAITDLTVQVVWPSDLATFHTSAMMIRASTHRSSPFSVDTGMVGRQRQMMLSPLGRAYMAFCPDGEREHILSTLRRSDHAEDRLAHDVTFVARMIAQTRDEGYGACRDQADSRCASIAVPIISGETVLACINVVWIRSGIDYDDAIQRYAPHLQQTRKTIEDALAEEEAPQSGEG